MTKRLDWSNFYFSYNSDQWNNCISFLAPYIRFSYKFTLKHFASRPAEKWSISRNVMITLHLGCYFKRKKTAHISTGRSGFWIKVFQNKNFTFLESSRLFWRNFQPEWNEGWKLLQKSLELSRKVKFYSEKLLFKNHFDQ